MGLNLKVRSLKSIGEEIGESGEEVKQICKDLNIPTNRRGSGDVVNIEMFEKHYNSGKPRRRLTKEHLDKMQNARKKKGGK